MPVFDTFENRLSRLYTWPQQAKQGKNPKNTAQMHHSCTLSGRKPHEKLIHRHLFFPLSIFDGEGARGQESSGGALQRQSGGFSQQAGACNAPMETLPSDPGAWWNLTSPLVALVRIKCTDRHFRKVLACSTI